MNIKRWMKYLKYKFRKFGVSPYSILDPKESEGFYKDFIFEYGNFKNTYCKGQGEKIAILDTGVDFFHNDLKGKVQPISFVEDSGLDYVNHGTFMCGEIVSEKYGIAPKAKVLSMKVLHGNGKDNDLYDFELKVTKAIQQAAFKECGVISMSFGSPNKSEMIEDAISQAVKLGCIPIAAAGNEGMKGSTYKSYPAAFENCISVGSANRYGLPAWYSTAGIGTNPFEQPEVAIASLNRHYGTLCDNKYGFLSGTSIACPIVAGIALLWREHMKKQNKLPEGENVLKEFRKWLAKHSVDTNRNGWDNELGFGVLQIKSWESL